MMLTATTPEFHKLKNMAAPQASWLSTLASYHVVAAANYSFVLPTHSGSILRGAFGKALKAQQCCCGASSTHKANCLYAIVFEGLGGEFIRGSQPPPRFIIQNVSQDYSSERNTFEFIITLLGLTDEQQQYTMAAWPYALKTGLGEQRVPCEVLSLSKLPNSQTQPLDATSITLELTTPWQIKRSGKALNSDQCTANDILFAINHRLALLNNHFQLGIPHLSASLLSELCASMTSTCDLGQSSWRRYSSRQEKSHPLAGITGQVKLSGEKVLQQLNDVLQAGQYVNAGGKTSFGLGGYRVITSNDI